MSYSEASLDRFAFFQTRPPDHPVQPALDTMLQEIQRVEAMVENVGIYIETVQREPQFVLCSLRGILRSSLRRLREEGWSTDVEVLPGGALDLPLDSDPHLLGVLFYQLLRNALEAAQAAPSPIVRVSGAEAKDSPASVTVELFNNGRVPSAEEMEHLFAPFYSSQPAASGFGLPIAALIAHKVQGDLELKAVRGEGTRTLVTFPLRPHVPGKSPPAGPKRPPGLMSSRGGQHLPPCPTRARRRSR